MGEMSEAEIRAKVHALEDYELILGAAVKTLLVSPLLVAILFFSSSRQAAVTVGGMLVGAWVPTIVARWLLDRAEARVERDAERLGIEM